MRRACPFASVALAVFAFTLAVSRPASASDTNTVVTVTELVVYADSHHDVHFSATVCNDTAVGNKDWAHTTATSTPSLNADGLKEMLTVLTAAKLAGRSLKIVTNGPSGNMCLLGGVSLL